MGKIIYEPKKNEEEVVEVKRSKSATPKSETRYNELIENIDSVRPVGDTQCEYGVYLEDYAYTYIYQYAATDLGREYSGVLLGEYYADTKEMIICGMMPIPMNRLSEDSEWINAEAIESLTENKEKYFPGAKVLGWFHMQPGYGTMLTMKEVKIQREFFDKVGTLLLLIDPINKIETFYAYDEGTLKEQTGYFLYYDKNPSMQQYMLDNPFLEVEKEAVDDTVVHQFREIGKIRKKEYQQRKRTNFTVVAASIAILALGAVVIKMSDQNKQISKLQSQLEGNNVQAVSTETKDENNNLTEGDVKFIINTPAQSEAEPSTEANVETTPAEESNQQTEGVKVVDNTKVNLTPNQTPVEENNTDENATDQGASEEQATTDTDTDVATDTDTQTDTQTEETQTTDEEDSGNYMTYKVQEGDTLRKISYDHYQTEKRAKEIIALNDLENGDEIYVGQTLKLPEK